MPEREFFVERGPGAWKIGSRMLPIVTPDGEIVKLRGPSVEGRRIHDSSDASRRSLLYTVNQLDWESLLPVAMVDLTYPADWQGVTRMDGDVVRSHHKRFRNRWEYKFGKARGIWKREFQERG